MKFINCPFPECNQTYSVNAIITKVLPFRQRLGIWSRQFMLHKNSAYVSLKKLKNNSMSSTTTTTTGTAAATLAHTNVKPIAETSNKNDKKRSNTITTTNGGAQKRLSKEFLELALKEGWARCPNCKYFVERQEGCRHIKCRCGIRFCYLCGTQFCKKDSCYKNRDNLHAELQSMHY
ncbi:hypothetical protein BDC45DRAFT_536629 [Circinella umbellata]|nr:hypothetical protein BDC45DRAFT_536629 [Circinella umbellata]